MIYTNNMSNIITWKDKEFRRIFVKIDIKNAEKFKKKCKAIVLDNGHKSCMQTEIEKFIKNF